MTHCWLCGWVSVVEGCCLLVPALRHPPPPSAGIPPTEGVGGTLPGSAPPVKGGGKCLKPLPGRHDACVARVVIVGWKKDLDLPLARRVPAGEYFFPRYGGGA